MTETRTEMLPGRDSHLKPSQARPGQHIGKYIVRCTIGAGGCGTVYAAYDPLLEREVALKLLARTDGATFDAGWSTLVREARMLARLSEPQVVTIYDVGHDDGQPFLAMQMVTGGDLKQWIARHRGPAPQAPLALAAVLDLLEQAGRGLAVAHEAGVVHGDFKPANVLIDDRGRAKVSDFGIARLAEAHVAAPDDVAQTLTRARVMSARITSEPLGEASEPAGDNSQTFTTAKGRAVVGTPAYMTPEQFDGSAADLSSDIYAFCATLYHAIYGSIPFAGGTLLELAARKASGNLSLPSSPAVPGWLSRVLTRGLHARREQRYPTMAAVLTAIEHGRRPPRRRWFLAGGALCGAVIVAAGMTLRTASIQPGCETTGAQFPWTQAVGTQVMAGLHAAGDASSTTPLERVAQRMDEFALQWHEAREAACTAVWTDPQLAHKAFACLRRRRSVAAALIEVWGEPSAAMTNAALSAVSALPSVTACVDPEALVEQPDLPTEHALREPVIAARERIDAASARARSGQAADALALAKTVNDEVAALGYPPLVAQSALAYGQALEISGELEAARDVLRTAFFAAQGWDDHETAAAAAERLVYVVGTRLDEHEQGLLWAQHARVALAKSGGLTAVVLAHEASILGRLGRHEQALAGYRASLQAHPATDPYGHGVTHMRMGDALRAMGQAQEALEHYDQALAKWSEVLGAEHPRLGIPMQSRATALGKLNRNDEAIAVLEQAIKKLQKLLGPDHYNVGAAFVNLGIVLKHSERFAEAEAAMRESLRITLAAYDETHLKVAHRREALGRLLVQSGRAQDAIALHTQVRATYTRELAIGHPDHVLALLNLADAEQATGRHEQGLQHYSEAVATAQAATGEGLSRSELEGDALAYLGRGLVRAGRPEQAQPHLVRALALLHDTKRYLASRTMAADWLERARG